MLFNTLTYAKFFAVVFVISWLLVRRRWALLLPWVALAGYASFSGAPSYHTVGVPALALALTLSLVRTVPADGIPTARTSGAALLVNAIALCWITLTRPDADILKRALGELGDGSTGLILYLLTVGLAAGVLYALTRARKVRLLFVLGASYVFYAHWDWRFLPLIWGSSTADWLLGNAIARSQDPRRRRWWLAGTVALNLGVLGIFKYFNFGIESASAALSALGMRPPEVALRIALPIGVSFFTFESMSYVIDIYRKQLEPQKSYAEYLSFVAFFPHLVAGPIVRPRDLLPQLAGPARWSSAEASEGLFLIAVGLLKKVAIGDYLALGLVDRVFDAPVQYSSLECYVAVLGYAVQIYCDFSGYTDIAIGSALLLGVRFPLNFNAPYKAHNMVEFWRRWHISLSTWLRDYLYIPLGGNRRGPARTYANLMITMLLGGLWHGASWTFVVWGGIHGTALAVSRALIDRRTAAGGPAVPSGARRVAGVVLTFHVVCAAWVFFRAGTFQGAWVFFAQLSQGTAHYANLNVPVLTVLGIGLASHWMPESWYLRLRGQFIALPAAAQALLLLGVAYTLDRMASAEAVPFVYFQF